MRDRWRKNSNRGFTLMEVIMAVFIFLTGIVGVISLFAAATVLHHGARDKAGMALALDQVIAEIACDLENGRLSDGEGGIQAQVEGDIPGQARLRYRADLEESGEPGRSTVQARITLLYMEKGQERGEVFDYIFKPGPGLSRALGSIRKEIEESSRRKGRGLVPGE